jgi:Zn-dependent protease with chaperone function
VRPAALLFGYAVAVAWSVPALLGWLTARGVSPRLGLAAWLTAIASVLAATAAALQFLARAALAGWNSLAEVVCRSVAGHACAPTTYQGAAFEFGLGALVGVAGLAATAAGWRFGRSIQRAQQQTRRHASVARMAGHKLPAGDNAAVVLDAPQPVAYCLAGRPATIVVTSAALELLDPAQLGAVLAHERAHLASRHHALVALTRGLGVIFPAVPLFARGGEHIGRLAEMCADDAAARRSGRGPLVTALLSMATGVVVPAAALGASACAVTLRVQRLIEAPPRGRQARCRVALAAVIVLLVLAPSAAAVLGGR